MKKTYQLILFSTIVFMSSCITEKEELSEILTEKGVVVDLVYTPKNHGSDLGVGITTGGDLSFTPVDVNIPEKYAVVFKCHDHNAKFVIQNNQQKANEMWHRLTEHQEVVISYRKVFNVTYDGDKEIKRDLKDLQFVDAK